MSGALAHLVDHPRLRRVIVVASVAQEDDRALRSHLGSPPLPELAQARTQKALRQWTYDVDELVRLQVNPGWLHHGESVLTVPAPHPRLDDQSQAALHLLTGGDALSDFLSYLTPLDAADQAPVEAPTLQEAFDDWLRLTTWSELWLAQNEHGLIVRRSLLGAPLAYGEWLNDLARARRFVVRALAVLNTGQWYDFETLLRFLHCIRADFLRNERGKAALPVLAASPGRWDIGLNVFASGREIMDFSALAGLIDRLSANPLHRSELVTELLHLLPGFDTGHLRYVVVVQTLRVFLNQVENFFFIRFTRHSRSLEM